jgi:beta-glucosidase/6-phospho-beta-glucosidase/beta-galactosidase
MSTNPFADGADGPAVSNGPRATHHFGLFHVDDTMQHRTAKDSTACYAEVIRTKRR